MSISGAPSACHGFAQAWSTVKAARGPFRELPAGFLQPEKTGQNPPPRRPRRRIGKEAVMAETWSGEFYCVKCKEKRQADGEVRVNDKGTRMAQAICPVCGTKLNRILGKA